MNRVESKINYKRVRQIKLAIYIFFALLFLIPALITVILGFRILQATQGSGGLAVMSRLSAEASAAAISSESIAENPSESIAEDQVDLGSAQQADLGSVEIVSRPSVSLPMPQAALPPVIVYQEEEIINGQNMADNTPSDSATEDCQYIEDDPLSGSIEVDSLAQLNSPNTGLPGPGERTP